MDINQIFQKLLDILTSLFGYLKDNSITGMIVMVFKALGNLIIATLNFIIDIVKWLMSLLN